MARSNAIASVPVAQARSGVKREGALCVGMVVLSMALGLGVVEHEKGIWWMPWHREAMKDVARCEKLGGGASTR